MDMLRKRVAIPKIRNYTDLKYAFKSKWLLYLHRKVSGVVSRCLHHSLEFRVSLLLFNPRLAKSNLTCHLTCSWGEKWWINALSKVTSAKMNATDQAGIWTWFPAQITVTPHASNVVVFPVFPRGTSSKRFVMMTLKIVGFWSGEFRSYIPNLSF